MSRFTRKGGREKAREGGKGLRKEDGSVRMGYI